MSYEDVKEIAHRLNWSAGYDAFVLYSPSRHSIFTQRHGHLPVEQTKPKGGYIPRRWYSKSGAARYIETSLKGLDWRDLEVRVWNSNKGLVEP